LHPIRRQQSPAVRQPSISPFHHFTVPPAKAQKSLDRWIAGAGVLVFQHVHLFSGSPASVACVKFNKALAAPFPLTFNPAASQFAASSSCSSDPGSSFAHKGRTQLVLMFIKFR